MIDWTDIHQDFTKELQKEWEELGFDYEQVEKWIENACLEPTDAEFAFFLINCGYNVEDIEEWEGGFVNSMRDQYNEAKKEKIDPSRERKSTDENSLSRNRRSINSNFSFQLIQERGDDLTCEEHADWVNINFPAQQGQNNEEWVYYNEKSDWFAPSRWLTDQEIDWVCQQLETSDKYKIPPAHQFHYVKEIENTAEAQAYMAFPELVAELDANKYELVFIPVVQNEFHWSLLVYETNSKNFCHFDTLNGANYEYVKPLVKDILITKEVPESEWESHLIHQHDIHQGNGYDCGVAVIAFIQKIIENYSQTNALIEFNSLLDLTNERKLWRKKWEEGQLIAQVQIPQKD